MVIKPAWLLNSSLFLINLLIAIGFLLKGQSHQIANPAAASLFYLGVILLERFSAFKLKNYLRGLLILTLIGHSMIGELFRAYYTTAYFDNILHFAGSFTFALLAFQILNSFVKIKSSHPAFLAFLLISLLGISLGVFFELLEFSLDQLFKEHNQFGLIDTDLDLLFDVLGSLSAGLFLTSLDSFKN